MFAGGILCRVSTILERAGNRALHQTRGALAYGLVFSPFVARYPASTGMRCRPGSSGRRHALHRLGYEEDPKMGIPLPAAEEPNRYGIQLTTRRRASGISPGRRCWRSAAATAAAPNTRHHHEARGLHRPRHQRAGRRILPQDPPPAEPRLSAGNAQELPLQSETIDAVINVEAGPPVSRLPRIPVRGEPRSQTGRTFPLRRLPGPPRRPRMGRGAQRRSAARRILARHPQGDLPGMDGSSVASVELINKRCRHSSAASPRSSTACPVR